MEMPRNTWKLTLLLVLGAALTALTLVIPEIGFLEWFSMIPLIYAAIRFCQSEIISRRKVWLKGFLAGFSFYFVLFHWLVRLYPLDFVGMNNAASIAVIAAGILGIPALYGILSGFVFLLFRLIHKSGIFKRVPLLRPAVFAALWVLFEWCTSQTWMGVPWGRLALGQIEMRSLLWLSSVFGSYAVTFLIVFVNALLVEAGCTPKKVWLSGILAAAIFTVNLGCGLIWINQSDKPQQAVKAAVLQGNISSHEKWTNNQSFQVYSDLTMQAAAEGAELIVWPETVITRTPGAATWQQLRELSVAANADLIVGALYEADGKQYNALYFIDHETGVSETVYCKRHLVPFGEYMPMKGFFETVIPPLGELSMLSDFSEGTSTGLFESKWGKIGSLICFDSIYETLAIDSVRDGAELMVISSNDSWFYDSAAVYQHKAQAQLRAVETGKWYLRAANTGISAIIAPNGETVAQIPPLEKGYLIATVAPVTSQTIYSRIGNLFVYLCMGFLLCVPIVGFVLKRRKNT